MSTSQNDANATPAGDESSRQLGIVKWFNNKAGFGFVTSLEDSGKDIFVHHTGVSVDREQYKYLVQGEYVEFDLSKSDNSEHEWQAVNVRGIRSGPLMCETRFLNRQERTSKAQMMMILVTVDREIAIAVDTATLVKEEVVPATILAEQHNAG